jgi:hypothetical protein
MQHHQPDGALYVTERLPGEISLSGEIWTVRL